MTSSILAAGTRVQLKGLETKGELNGMGAKIMFYDHEAGRYQCELLGSQFEGQNVRCKPENMDVLKAPDDAEHKLESLLQGGDSTQIKARSRSRSRSSSSSSSSSSSTSSRKKRKRCSNFSADKKKAGRKDKKKQKKEKKRMSAGAAAAAALFGLQ
mmetsp:Transcript_71720/g.134139  ORF Transcript_71720/g.134139 Transcript_71720/m.134139 type:complete len:156 (+) Transcript_71720:83-550(+)